MKKLTSKTTNKLQAAKIVCRETGLTLNAKYKIMKKERSSHNETTGWNIPSRVELINQIFGFKVSNIGKATINLSEPWMISDIATHYSRPANYYKPGERLKAIDYTTEAKAIRKSCNYQTAALNNTRTTGGTIPKYNYQVYARIIDLPDNKLLVNILKDMKKNGCKDYEEYKVYKLGKRKAKAFMGGRPNNIKSRKAEYAASRA